MYFLGKLLLKADDNVPWNYKETINISVRTRSKDGSTVSWNRNRIENFNSGKSLITSVELFPHGKKGIEKESSIICKTNQHQRFVTYFCVPTNLIILSFCKITKEKKLERKKSGNRSIDWMKATKDTYIIFIWCVHWSEF